MPLRIPGMTALLLSATLFLSACESSEERAEKHFESGMALLEKGDVSRALVEFRNVFKLNPRHKEARLTYARAEIERGNPRKAYRQYLRLVEQYPDNLEGRVELAQMSFLSRNMEEAERHGQAAFDLAPEDPRTLVILTALEYTKARQNSDSIIEKEQAAILSKALVSDPSNPVARRVVVESLIRSSKFPEALIAVNDGLTHEPDSFELLMAKLRLQFQLDDQDGVESTLKFMIEKFPENKELQQTLITWYLGRDDLDGAETFLRELADAPDADPKANMVVVQFLAEVRGQESARAELEKLVSSESDTLAYKALLASMDFEEGKHDQAITDMEALLAEGEPSEDRRNAKILLARMLVATGNPVGARIRVEEIIAEDSGHVEALKMQAAWLIEEDKPGQAIIGLRTALGEAPNDADIMTLMGQAHERAGDRELAGERYALAAEVSGAAPAESLRYAAFLLADDRIEAAQTILQDALNKAPANIVLLRNMAAIHIGKQDWNRATRIVWALRALETPEANAVANGIEAETLSRQERTEETIAFLQGLVNEDGSSAAVLSALVETQVRNGEIDAATELVEERLAENPNDAGLRFLRAGLYFLSDQRAEAEKEYRALLEEFPENERVLRTYYSLLIAEGRDGDAGALIEKVLQKSPMLTSALVLKAQRLENEADFEGAIEIYEDLYSRNTGSVILANNLASLITTHRTDAESLERAYAIARRLRSIDIPAVQDTYGWIAHRQGDYEEALKFLEPAAKGLPQDPFVQFHLGMTYFALERNEDAHDALSRALEIAGDAQLRQFIRAREVLLEIEAAR